MADRLTADDHEAIRAFYPNWTARVLARDFDDMFELYTEDAVIMPPNHPALRGRDEILAFMQAFPKVTKAEFHVDEVDGRGDLAYVTGRYSLTLEAADAPGPVEDVGKFIEIRRRQADGSWKVSRDIFNSDLE